MKFHHTNLHGRLKQLQLHFVDGTDFDNVGNIGDGQRDDPQPRQLLRLLLNLVALKILKVLHLEALVVVGPHFDAELVISSH